MIRILLVTILMTATAAACAEPFPTLSGPYLGQELPGEVPVVFAPGAVSTGIHERDLLISDDGRTLWYGVMTGTTTTVLETRLVDGSWTEPVAVPFHRDPTFFCFEPTLSADGNLVLFLSTQAAPGQEQGTGWTNQNIFFSRRTAEGWTEAAAVPAPITSDGAEFFPSLATDGTLYFTRGDEEGDHAVWFAEPLEGSGPAPGFAVPTRLPEAVNISGNCYNATVAADESWIVACVAGHDENLGRADYWISFRGDDGVWLPAVNMGETFNGPGLRASSVSLSPDGQFFFFSTNRGREDAPFPDGQVTLARLQDLHVQAGNGSNDIWWVAASVLDRYRP
jgi:hypothetical protein